jgi:hypothetical protein
MVMASLVTCVPTTEILDINEKSVLFAQSLIDGTFNLEYLLNVKEFFTVSHINTTLLEKIGTFLNISTTYLYVDTNTNTNEKRSITFGELLLMMNDHDPHDSRNNNGCSCAFHRESLLTHSIFAMLKTYECISRDMPERYMLHISILALFHDIGKIHCVELLPKKQRIGFPFHGEHGSGIMLQLYVKNPFFSFTEWENMCRTIATHMCGYHAEDYTTNHTIYRMKLLSFERPRVLYMLQHLMYGDALGKIADASIQMETTDMVLSRREKFIKHTAKNNNMCKFLLHNCPGGIIIKLCGQSGSGKSTYCQHIVETFTNHYVPRDKILVIERDLVMCNIAAKSINPDAEEIVDRPLALEYSRLYDHYKKNKLGPFVNEYISKKIKHNTHKIIIFDSVANYYYVDKMLPSCTSNMLRINVSVIRGEPIDMKTCTRMAMNIPEQLKLFGNRSVVSWLPDGINLHTISSCSTNKEMREKEKIQPHLAYQVVWNRKMMAGANIVDDMLRTIAVSYMSNPDICLFLRSLGSVPAINTFFQSKHLVQKQNFNDNTFLIRYLDHNKSFHKIWMRQVRGSVFMPDYDSEGKLVNILCIKQLLPRGAEYLTLYHNQRAITENENSFGTYDDIQIEMMHKLETNAKIDSMLSCKSDGSLFGSIIIQKSSEYYDKFIYSCTNKNEVFNIMFELCDNLPFLVMPCSQNTLVFGELMMDYYATSICANYDININEMTCLEAFKCGMTKFLESIVIFDRMTYALPWVNKDQIKCLSFEAICKNRRSKWGSCHTELATSYENSMLLFLGCTFNVGLDPGQYVPHYELNEIAHECNFVEPCYWSVNNGLIIQDMLNDVEYVAQGLLEKNAFFDKYPCQNKYPTNNKVLDYEGFVILTKLPNNEYDYGKIKTSIFYKCHKLRTENIPWLLSLSEVTETHFPIVKTVKKFYTNIESKCQAYKIMCNKFIEECLDGTHSLMSEQNLLSKMMQTFHSKDNDTQKKIIIKAFTGTDKYLIDIFHQVFDTKLNVNDIKFAITMAYDVIINDANIYNDNKIMDRLFFLMNKQE